jgi:hypothetical protein
LDGLKFEEDETMLDGYHSIKNSGLSNACKKPMKKLKGKLDLWEWKQSVRKYWLTIADLQKMRHGERVEVVCLDRNVGDHLSHLKSFKMLRASKCFSAAMYTHDKDAEGTLVLDHAKGDPIELKPFDFHVEYAKDRWYPLYKGYLPAKDPQLGGVLLGKRTYWKDMPPNTAVGYRGPMVRVSDLKKMPDFYLYEEFR